jgi:hypothetical protein
MSPTARFRSAHLSRFLAQTKGRIQHLAGDLTVTAQTPPTFIAMAQDDPVVNAEEDLCYAAVLH